jgi:hypothetical protein
MNIGVYLHSLADTQQLKCAGDFINSCVELDHVSDASLFYNDVGANPFKIGAGMFNSTDIWNFNGILIVTSLECLISANKIVNNFKPYYYYGWEKHKINVLDLISNTKNIDIICNHNNDAQYIFRVTGKPNTKVCNNFENIMDVIRE